MSDTALDFRETVSQLWAACGCKKSWESGLCDRLAKNLMHIACSAKEPDGWSQTLFESAMDNYARRSVLLGR